MDIHCNNCGQKYHIPDYRLEEKRVHFFCEKCDAKIVIDGKDDVWANYSPEKNTPKTSRNILDGIFYSFNKKNFLTGILFFTGFTLFNLIFALIYSNAAEFLLKHTLLTGIITYILMILYTFTFDIFLYLISKNTFYYIKNNKSLKFSEIKQEIFHDLKPVFLFSSGFLLILGVFMLPFFIIKVQYSIIYSGIFHLPLASFLIIFIALTVFKNIVYAFFALKSRSIKQTFKSLGNFFRAENINIFFYYCAISIISFVLIIIAGTITAMSLNLLTVVSLKAAFPQLSNSLAAVADLLFRGMDTAPKENIFLQEHYTALSAGMYLTGLSLYIIFTCFIVYTINLVQSLAVTAVHIMENNPGKSVNRRALLISMAIGFFLLIFTVLLLYSKHFANI